MLVNRTDESSEVWVYDPGSKIPARVTSDAQTNDRPERFADGRRVAYRVGPGSYWWPSTDGTDKPQLLIENPKRSTGSVAGIALIPDGKGIIARIPHLGTGMDLMLSTIGDSASTKALVRRVLVRLRHLAAGHCDIADDWRLPTGQGLRTALPPRTRIRG